MTKEDKNKEIEEHIKFHEEIDAYNRQKMEEEKEKYNK